MNIPTQTPLPKFRDIFFAIYQKEVSDEDLANPWTSSDDEYYWFSRSMWALQIIAQWRQKLLSKKNITIWVPSFFCNETLEPLRKMGVNLIFLF